MRFEGMCVGGPLHGQQASYLAPSFRTVVQAPPSFCAGACSLQESVDIHLYVWHGESRPYDTKGFWKYNDCDHKPKGNKMTEKYGNTMLAAIRNWGNANGINMDNIKLTFDLSGHHNALQAKRSIEGFGIYGGSGFEPDGSLKAMGIKLEFYGTETITTRHKV